MLQELTPMPGMAVAFDAGAKAFSGYVGYESTGWDYPWRTLLRFAVPPGYPTSKILRLTLTPVLEGSGSASHTVDVDRVIRDWDADANWTSTGRDGPEYWGGPGAELIGTDIAGDVKTSASFQTVLGQGTVVDIDVSDYPLAAFSTYGLWITDLTHLLKWCTLTAKLRLTWPEYTATAAALTLPLAGLEATAFYADYMGQGILALPPAGLVGAGYYLSPGYELLGCLTLPEWFGGDIVVSQLSAEQPLRFFLRATDDSAAIGKTPVVEIRKHGAAAWTTPLGAVSELGHGWYQVAYFAADQDTPGQLLLRATAAGCQAAAAAYLVMGDQNPYTGVVDSNLVSVATGVEVDANLVKVRGQAEAAETIKKLYGDGATIGTVTDYSPTADGFGTDLSADYDDDFCADHLLVMVSGATAEQHRVIATYDAATKYIRLAVPLTEAPAPGDLFVLTG